MSTTVPPPTSYAALHAALGVEVPEELLAQALTHRSFAYEHGGLPTNERLEFLGDAVLGLVVTDLLYRRSPELPEGQLAPLRASVVSSRALAGLARRLGLGEWLRLGKGELSTGGRDKSTILADTLEAVIGAVYLAHGIEAASTMVLAMVEPELRAVERRGGAVDWKTALQELAAARGTAPPSYVVSDRGPDHAKHFTAHVHLDGVAQGTGEGPTKKEAEQEAAREAVTLLEAATVLPGDAAPGAPAAD